MIADDETDIVTLLAEYFRMNGYEVLAAANGAETLKQVEKNPDLILLDINMPEGNGLEICARIRRLVHCPILFLTARIEDSDKIRGFQAGGDDYIVKPFSLAELGARVAAHLRREERHLSSNKLRFAGDLSIDYASRTLTCAECPVALAKKEFDIVELLSTNGGQVFDRERIYERIWGCDSDGDSSVIAEHIRRIRAKLSAVSDRTYIETVWGVGYKWVG